MKKVYDFIHTMVSYYTQNEGKYPSPQLSIGMQMLMDSPEFHEGISIALDTNPSEVIELLNTVSIAIEKIESDR